MQLHENIAVISKREFARGTELRIVKLAFVSRNKFQTRQNKSSYNDVKVFCDLLDNKENEGISADCTEFVELTELSELMIGSDLIAP